MDLDELVRVLGPPDEITVFRRRKNLETICSAMEGHSEKMDTCKPKNQEEALDQH